MNANIPASYHMPQATPPAPISVDVQPHVAANPPVLSPLLSPLVSPNWQYPSPTTFGQPPPFVGMLHQPQFMYGSLHSLGSSG